MSLHVNHMKQFIIDLFGPVQTTSQSEPQRRGKVKFKHASNAIGRNEPI